MLSAVQIEQIAGIVERAGIFYSHLHHDLVDHICCDVEEEIKHGLSFNEALERVRQKFGIQTLINIQQDTLYLTDLKYRKMKNKSKTTGIIGLGLIALGALFKIQHWPGAGPMLILGFFVLITFFYPTAIFINYRETKQIRGKLFLHISALLGGIAFMTGVLFKVQHWPGAWVMLEAGWLTISLIFLPVFLYLRRKESKTKREKLLYTAGIFAVSVYDLATLFKIMHLPGAAALLVFGSLLLLVFFILIVVKNNFNDEKYVTGKFIFLITASLYFIIFSTLLSLNVSKDVLSSFRRGTEQTSLINKYLSDKVEHFYYKLPNTDRTGLCGQLYSGSNEVRSTINEMKRDMVMLADNVSREEALNKLDTIRHIVSNDNYEVVHEVALKNGRANILKDQIVAFRELLSEDDPNTQSAKELLRVSDDPHPGYHVSSWDSLYFYHATLVSAMNSLAKLEKNILLVQLDVYRNSYFEGFHSENEKLSNDSIIDNAKNDKL